MRPIDFPESNVTYDPPPGVPESQIGKLRAYKDNEQMISCWKMEGFDKVRALFYGKVYVGVIGKTQPPLYLTTYAPFVDSEENKSDDFLEKYLDRKIDQFMLGYEPDKVLWPETDPEIRKMLQEFTAHLLNLAAQEEQDSKE